MLEDKKYDEPAETTDWVDYFNGAMKGKEFLGKNGERKMIVMVKPGEYMLKNHTPQRIRILSGSLKYSLFPFNVTFEAPQGTAFEIPRIGFVFIVEKEMSYIATQIFDQSS